MVPNTVEIAVLTVARTSVLRTAESFSALLKRVPYHSVVKPIQGPPRLAELNEYTITTTMGV
jgi:hypothetical protein